jgi:hypothetical protein
MSGTRGEIEVNFDAFTASWKGSLPVSIAALDPRREEFLRSYSRIVSMNAWRGNFLANRVSAGSMEFFAEALNDALVSHVLARCGSWRSALMSLRSCVENTCYCLYYMDHAIELRLWESGRHRPAFSEIHTYLEQHPDVSALGNSPVTGLATIKEEYATLSRAVHASAKSFRMTPNPQGTSFWKADPASLGQWRTREQRTLCGLNLLMTTLFCELLQGAQQILLRRALWLVIPVSLHARVKSELKVNIPLV